MSGIGRNLDGWLDHIGQVHYRSIDLTLDRVRRVAHCLRLPATTRYITVAGTNGKGSSVAYLESIYREAGFATGAYTSPHLVRYNERVRLNGRPVSDELLEAAFLAVETARCGIPLTYFEFGTLAALWVFRHELPDVVILEVGMGGRLDAVNIVDSDIALITAIGLDHQQWLGNTVEKIAIEKAGVLRHRGIAVSSGCRPPATLGEVAARKRCDLWQLGLQFGYESRRGCWDWLPLDARLDDSPGITGLPIPPGGIHQLDNAAGVIAVVRRLAGCLPVSDENIARGLAQAQLPGRLHRVAGDPELLLDVSHNRDGLEALSAYLRDKHAERRVLGVFSMLGDKDIRGALESIAPRIRHWFIAPLDSDRAAPPEMLRSAILSLSEAPMEVATDIRSAADRALSMAADNDLVVVFGSFIAVGDIMKHLHLDPYPASR
jgi:dihydrofolate synthase / folylpolyglutamate synthase